MNKNTDGPETNEGLSYSIVTNSRHTASCFPHNFHYRTSFWLNQRKNSTQSFESTRPMVTMNSPREALLPIGAALSRDRSLQKRDTTRNTSELSLEISRGSPICVYGSAF